MEKLIYTWDEQLSDTDDICDQIEKDKFLPDVIVGISRGGLIPGVMISHKLNIPFKPVHASTRDFPHWENYLPKANDMIAEEVYSPIPGRDLRVSLSAGTIPLYTFAIILEVLYRLIALL